MQTSTQAAHPLVAAVHDFASSLAIHGGKRHEAAGAAMHEAAQRLQADLTFYLTFIKGEEEAGA